jgi:DNA-binding response OmpR family regulator
MKLAGKRAMIVEDEFLLALSLEDDLQAAGATVVGPYSTLSATLEAIGRESFDFAVLDVNLNGEMSYAAADALLDKGAPFILVSGYSSANLPARYRELRRLSKPYDTARLLETLQAAGIA